MKLNRNAVMKVLVKEPFKEPQVREIENRLKNFQEAVGGWIECVHPFEKKNITLVVNEEGAINGMRANYIRSEEAAEDEGHKRVLRFFGPVLLCAEDEEDPSQFRGLSEEEIAYYSYLMRV